MTTFSFDLIAYTDITVTGLPLNIPVTFREVVLGIYQYSMFVGYMIYIGNGIRLSMLFSLVILPVFKKIKNISTVVYTIIF